MITDPILTRLGRLVGRWTTEATHPSMPGVVVHGTATIEWLEGERFLTIRARVDHPDFPDSLSVIGNFEHDRVDGATRSVPEEATTSLRMHYFDSRGVFRLLEASIDDAAWRLSRLAPGFSQRFTGTFTDGGNTIVGLWELCEDDVHWANDLAITYRREG